MKFKFGYKQLFIGLVVFFYSCSELDIQRTGFTLYNGNSDSRPQSKSQHEQRIDRVDRLLEGRRRLEQMSGNPSSSSSTLNTNLHRELRLMESWQTSPEGVDSLLDRLEEKLREDEAREKEAAEKKAKEQKE